MIKSIVFVITTRGTGKGGHFYSLATTAKALQIKYDVHIINIGCQLSPVIEGSGVPCTYIKSNFHDQLFVTYRLVKAIKKINPDIIHAFDYISYLLVFGAAKKCKLQLALTKCGGPTRKNYPYTNNLIVYTKEDFVYYQSVSNAAETQIALISNRVTPFQIDYNRVSALRTLLKLQDKRVILRIGRIGSYIATAKQCINMVRAFHEIDDRFVLVFVGFVDNQKSYEKLKEETSEDSFIHFVTDKQYTLNSKELLDVGEIVVGTGRSFMEACYLGKKVMAPNQGQKYPVLVTPDNFDKVFYFNFSERYSETSSKSASDLLASITNCLIDTHHWFQLYFSSEQIESLYTSFYNHLKPVNYGRISNDIRWKRLYFWLSNIKWLRTICGKR